MKKKPKVAFLCLHNSCRSQVAKALAEEFASDTFEAYSAGSEPSYTVDDKAAWMLLEYCSRDITEENPKHISELPDIDIVITLGHDGEYLDIPCTYTEDWGLDVTKGKDDAAYRDMIEIVRKKIFELRERIKRDGVQLTT
jgi:arsenate reductase